MDIAKDFPDWVAVGIHRSQRRKPGIQKVFEQGSVDRFLAIEIIKDVRLGQSRFGGDLIQRRPAIAEL